MGKIARTTGLLLILGANPAIAQEAEDEFVTKLSSMTVAECNADREQRSERYARAGAGDLLPLQRVVEAQRLVCVSLTLQSEHSRLEGEAARLEAEIMRIESEWKRDHERDPDKYPDFAGRDRSQKIMAADIRGIRGAQAGLKASVDQLRGEATRLLALSVEDAVELDEDDLGRLQLAADADDMKSIFDRFREFMPPKTA